MPRQIVWAASWAGQSARFDCSLFPKLVVLGMETKP
jgi:hypothetical protein